MHALQAYTITLTHLDSPDDNMGITLTMHYPQKRFSILSSSQRCKDIFKSTPLVPFLRTNVNNLRNILTKSTSW